MSLKKPQIPGPSPASRAEQRPAPVLPGSPTSTTTPSKGRQVDALAKSPTSGTHSADFEAHGYGTRPPNSAAPPQRISLEVTFEDGNSLRTEMNGTLEEAREYYVGKAFNFGDRTFGEGDRMVRATKVELLPEDAQQG